MAHTSSWKGKLVAAIAAIALIIGGYFAWRDNSNTPAQKYKTETVDRGDIVQTVSANGTLNPVILVNVGTQVSGTIYRLHTDFNSKVTAGQILAELDPALLEAQVRQSEANLSAAQANLRLAESKETRTRTLVAKGFISQAELDQAVQTLDAARAQVNVTKAQLERDRTNLRLTVIRSPISGVVVARNVDLGQTVAASFQTPTLFQIAQDLREMQIDTSLAEADIGNIRVGLGAKFTVDAFAERVFKGTVKQVRLNPVIQQNVVSYNVVVSADNSEGLLMPGMTAHVQIVVTQRDQALRVPNAALRFKPKENTTEGRGEVQAGPRAESHKNGGRGTSAHVYKLTEDKLQSVAVKTGISDNQFTEITSGELQAGDPVVVREIGAKTEKDGSGFRMRPF